MSEQLSLQGTEIAGSAFPIGSRRAATFRLSTLFTASLAVLVLHYLVLWKLTNWLGPASAGWDLGVSPLA